MEMGKLEGVFDLVAEKVVSAGALEGVGLDLAGGDPAGDGVAGDVEEFHEVFGGEELGVDGLFICVHGCAFLGLRIGDLWGMR